MIMGNVYLGFTNKIENTALVQVCYGSSQSFSVLVHLLIQRPTVLIKTNPLIITV